jgi:5-methylcytosine-specific restriction endonuclease McrA
MSRALHKRRRLHAEAGGRCEYCGAELPLSRAKLDHITPRSRGGGNGRENLACVCRGCDSRKRDSTPAELLRWAEAVVAAQERKIASRRVAG